MVCLTRTRHIKALVFLCCLLSLLVTIQTLRHFIFANPYMKNIGPRGKHRVVSPLTTGRLFRQNVSSSSIKIGTRITIATSCCEPWPLPWTIKQNRSQVYVFNRRNFTIDVVSRPTKCDLLRSVIKRYVTRIRGRHADGSNATSISNTRSDAKVFQKRRCLRKLDLSFTTCSSAMNLVSDESYTLEIHGDEARLEAGEIWGILRGLETFTQLLGRCGDEELCVWRTHIEDKPRFPHRGLMLDTARHYLDLSVIKRNIDAMEMNKLNVFHWHLTDDQSFPFQSQVYPGLSMLGSFSPREVYSRADVEEIIEYARVRGVRVIPELDSPGHTGSWRGAGSNLLAEGCTGRGPGLLNLSSSVTYEVLENLVQEIADVFQYQTLHVGGDEIPDCSQQRSNKSKSERKQLLQHYFDRLHAISERVQEGLELTVWSDLLLSGIQLDPSIIVQVWSAWDEAGRKSLLSAVNRGHRLVYSSGWYLDDLGDDWAQLYQRDPTDMFAESAVYRKSLLGGEACMWGEKVDAVNLLQTVWPRASAVAERLLSQSTARDPREAEDRLAAHRCRMLRRGIPASPIRPGTCSGFSGV